MNYYFQQVFIDSVHKLRKKRSYRDCEAALIESVFSIPEKDFFAQCEGFRINPSGDNPIAKLRVASGKGKSSSYRLYIYVIKRDKDIYFGHLYPKTGSKGKEALNSSEEIEVIKSLLREAKLKSMRKVYLNSTKNKICFEDNDAVVWKK